MALARDASSPAAFQISGNGSGTDTGTSASFTPPAGAWVYASATFNTGAGASPTFSASNTGGGLGSWTQVTSQINAAGGSVVVFRALVNSSVATTVTVTCTSSGNTNTAWNAEGFVDVWTGAATSQTSAATATGTSTTQNISPTVTTTANNSQVSGVAVDWNRLGSPTSTDVYTAYSVSGSGTSGLRAYKAAPVATPAATAVNFNAAAAGPIWSYALVEILAGANIIQQPGSVRITDGDKAYLNVVATNVTSYQWQDNRTGSFVNTTDGTGATTADLVTPALTTAATGRQYRCVIDGTLNSSAATVTVDTKYPTSISNPVGTFDPALRTEAWF